MTENVIILLKIVQLISLTGFLTWVSARDAKYHKIKNAVLPVIFFLSFSLSDASLKERIVCGISIFLILFLVNLITKDGIGMGDAKLCGVFGLSLGINGIFGAVIGMILAFAASVFVRIFDKSGGSNREEIALAPYLCAGFVLAILTILLK